MIRCDRCGRGINYPMGIRYTRSVALVNSVFNCQMDDYKLCPKCAESFKRWLWHRNIKDD